MTERRYDPRVPTVLEAIWHGQSGAAPCRVTDLCASGCFVQTVNAPPVGEETSVTVMLGKMLVNFHGRVRYVESHMGFGLHLEAMSDAQRAAIGHLMSAGAMSA